jgi:hypothetical protein
MRMPEKKRRQHHVWQHYLKSWATDNQIWCLREGSVFQTNTTKVAVERDFYKIPELTSEDIALIKWLVINPAQHPRTQANHENFLALLTAPSRLAEQFRKFAKNPKELDDLLDIIRTNVLEDYHAGIEDSFSPLLDEILRNDLSFYADEQRCITFTHFLCTQHMRTKNIKEKSIERVGVNGGPDMSRIWDIMSHMFAVNIGTCLYLERSKRTLSLIQNRTDVPFVTGDQPIINLHGDGATPPEALSFYYPVSPRLALLWPEVGEAPAFTTDGLTPTQAGALNMRMLEACHSQVFAQTESELLFLKKASAKTEPSD